MHDTDTEPQRPESYPPEQWETLMPASRQWVSEHWESLMANRVQLPERRAPQTYPPDADTIVGESPSQDASVDMFGETLVRAADVVDPEALPELVPDAWDAPVAAVVVEVVEVVEVREDTVWDAPVAYPVAAVVEVVPELPEAVDGTWVADADERPTAVTMEPPAPARVQVGRPRPRPPQRIGPWLVVDIVEDDAVVEFALQVQDVSGAWSIPDANDGSVLYVVGDGAVAVARFMGEAYTPGPMRLEVEHTLRDVLGALLP